MSHLHRTAPRLATLLGLGALACDATQTVVHLEADEASLAGVTELRVRACNLDGERILDATHSIGGDQGLSATRPALVPFHPRDGDATRGLGLIAELLDDTGAVVARQRAYAGFVGGARLDVVRRFEASCALSDAGATCADDAVCTGGACAAGGAFDASYPEGQPPCCFDNADCTWGLCVDGACDEPIDVAAATSTLYIAPEGPNGLHACALFESGRVACWGGNNMEQLGTTSTDVCTYEGTNYPCSFRPLLVPALDGATALVAPAAGTCVILDGSVTCWGDFRVGASGARRVIRGVSDVVALVARRYHGCAVRSDGTVACWGKNAEGQLGDGTMVDTDNVAVEAVGVSNAVGASTGGESTCAVLADGALTCWGASRYFQLVDDITPDQIFSTPRPVSSLANVAQVVSGQHHSCARLADGSVVCWGRSSSGQTGVETMETHPHGDAVQIPEPVLEGGLAAEGTGCAIGADTRRVHCWGNNGSNELGFVSTPGVPHPIPVVVEGLPPIARITVGHDFVCALSERGAIYCWGKNDVGQLGRGMPSGPQATPARVLPLGAI